MHRKENVPVTFNGELVGRASTFDDGAVDIVIHDENLTRLINHQDTVCLTIGVDTVKPKSRFKVGDTIRSKTTGILWHVLEVSGDDPFNPYISVRSDSMINQDGYCLQDPLNFELVTDDI